MTIRNGRNIDAKTIAEFMRLWYISNRETNDNRKIFYCGITNDPETRKGTHEREDHDGEEIEKMLVYECDNVDVAADITCPIAFKVGYVDIVTPPHAGYAAFNACPAMEKAMFDSVGFGHKTSQADSVRLRSWMLGRERGR